MREYNTDRMKSNSAISLYEFGINVRKKRIKQVLLVIFILFIVYISFGVYKNYKYKYIYNLSSSKILDNHKYFYYYGYNNKFKDISINTTYYGLTGVRYIGNIDNIDHLNLDSKVQFGKGKLLVVDKDNKTFVFPLENNKTKLDIPISDNYNVYLVGDMYSGSCKLRTNND